MDKTLDSVDDIRSALESKPEADLQAGREELAEHLNNLKQHAKRCTTATGSAVKKFTAWHSEVRKINLAYSEKGSNYHLSLSVASKADLILPTFRGRNSEPQATRTRKIGFASTT